MTSGLRQPQTYSRLPARRPSVTTSERPGRIRTMSDAAPSVRADSLRSPLKRLDLRKSLWLEEDEHQEQESRRKFRTSAPLLDAYGVPQSAGKSNATPVQTSLPPSELDQKIRVCVRKRPLNRKEMERSEKDVAPTLGHRTLHINEPKLKLDLSKYTEQHTFTFDDVFDSQVSNATVYERTALPLVGYIFRGGKATCFAYGQTGSGKTYTMLDPQQGLYILAARDIFAMLRQPENAYLTAWIGLYEIYQGQLYDLLNDRKKLFAREDGKSNVIITGLKEYPIDHVDKLIQVFEYGSSVRTTGSTGANDSSSRSHAVLQILLKHKANKKRIHGKLSFIDLAGSERGADRGEADTKTRMEGAEINKSLLALKECIRALDKDKQHTPFRQSKLTQVLKDSFVGHSRTCMVATISPGGSNSEHTLNTLRYADRVKELKSERDKKNAERAYSNPLQEELSAEEEVSIQADDDEEYFSNESDILDENTFNEENLLDVDFPHEQESFLQSGPGDAAYKNLTQQRMTTPEIYQSKRPHSMSYSSNVVYENHGSPRPLSLQSSQALPRSFSMYSKPSNDTGSDSSSTYSSHARSMTQTMPCVDPGVPQFRHEHIDEFIRFHRAEIRAMADCTKRENRMVANLTLYLSSQEEEKEVQTRRTTSEFLKYLQDLDELLEHKLAAVEALRDRISDTVGQIEF
ncbi:P-loop containing nucleoside triphosphate hydrolase protein [Sporodiniella umbellata]|nr:P-loop containing nucleoside triphosphate hydrolase protein [Sporodiniella umbellata]